MTPEERASTIRLDSICCDDFLAEDLDEVRRDIAQAIREAEREVLDNSYARSPQGLRHFGLRDENGSLSGLLTAEQVIWAAKAEAYEEAMKADCVLCAMEKPFDLLKRQHHLGGEAYSRCESARIRALIDSLAAESASS